MKKYVVVDSQDYIRGRYDTIPEAIERIINIASFKRLNILVEVSSIAYDTEEYFKLDGTRYGGVA